MSNVFKMKNFLGLSACIILSLNASFVYAEEMHSLSLNPEAIGLQTADFPQRPKPLLELGNPFLGRGPVRQGIQLPTGAVWQPSFIMWGNYRSAVQAFYTGSDDVAELAHRFDLFGNLYLSPTERILAGVRVLDQEGEFSSYTFSAPESLGDDGYNDETNFYVSTLFFEGDFGEMFPHLDKKDKHGLDFAFSIGRQPINFQEGMLINDSIDAIGISKINIKTDNIVNLRSTFIWGANELNRKNLSGDDNSSSLFGTFNEIDLRKTTIELDAIYVNADDQAGDGVYLGLGAIQRFGKYNTTFRILGSNPIGNETDHNASGLLLFGTLSFSPTGSDNHIYLTAFRAFDSFRSASRDPNAGGPLGQNGILFEAVGLGRYAGPLSNEADDAAGGSLGYQMFFNEGRQQLILELAGRYATKKEGQRAVGPGMSYKIALGQRAIIRLDGYVLYDKNRDSSPTDKQEYQSGGRIEFQWKF